MTVLRLLINNQWRESLRSVVWHRNLATNIFFGIVMFMVALNFLSLGVMIGQILEKVFPGADHVQRFNGLLIYYFLFDSVLRFFVQRNPGLHFKPYLGLPVSRSTLVNYLLFKSTLSFINLLPLFIFVPYTFQVIVPKAGAMAAASWLGGMAFLILTASLFNFYLMRRSFNSPGRLIAYFVVIASLVLCDYLDIFTLRDISAEVFGQLITNPPTVIIPMALLLLVYYSASGYFRKNLYLDRLAGQHTMGARSVSNYSFLESFGETGEFVALEIKLLIRNKRARSSMALAAVMLLVGAFFYASMQVAMEEYPQAEPLAEHLIPGQPVVTFRVEAGNIPEEAQVYITGDHARLNKWRRNYIPLEKQSDGSWQRRISFEEKSLVKFKFHLGKWDTERLEADGTIPRAFTMVVQGDTTMTFKAERWGEPEHLVFIDVMLIYMGVIFVGIMMLSYGQFMLAWESGYFDLILTQRINFQAYFRAKYLLLTVFGVLMFLITTPVIFISQQIFMVNLVLLIYNLGINSIIMFIMATYTRKKLDLDASIFSTQGKGANQFTLILPTMILPMLIFLPFALTDNREAGFAVLLFAGAAGLILHRSLLKWVIGLFLRQKYKITAAFKQN